MTELKHFSWVQDGALKDKPEDESTQIALEEATDNPGWDEEARMKAATAISAGAIKNSPSFNSGRRYSISAEPYTPSAEKSFHRVVIAKDDETKDRINKAISSNLLFRNLDEEQKKQIVDAMFEKKVPKNVSIIRQGDEGDYFYVISSGRFHVIKDNEFVVELGPGETFGELALMYGSPRMATVRAIEDAVCWAVDRQTFRSIVIDLAFRKRKIYEGFLRSVPLLQTLHDQEIYRICDALQSTIFKKDDVIVRQGDVGHEFYIIEEGEAKVTMKGSSVDASGQEVLVTTIGKGGYFGELALLKDAPRAATVAAVTPLVKCLTLNKADFIRLLGPLMPIMQRNREHYRKYEEYLSMNH